MDGNKFKKIINFIFLFDIIKGILITIKYLFKKKVTKNYPAEKSQKNEKFFGEHALILDSNGCDLCVGCKLCEVICPVNAIKVTSGIGKDGSRRANQYTIDMSKCIYCGLCVESCPVNAIVELKNFEFSKFTINALQYDKDKLINNGKI